MDFRSDGSGRVILVANETELIAVKGALLEADEAIRDDTAFSARVGATRTAVRHLREQMVAALRMIPREGTSSDS